MSCITIAKGCIKGLYRDIDHEICNIHHEICNIHIDILFVIHN